MVITKGTIHVGSDDITNTYLHVDHYQKLKVSARDINCNNIYAVIVYSAVIFTPCHS